MGAWGQCDRDVTGMCAYLLLVQLEGGLDQISQGGELLLLLILSLFDLWRENAKGDLHEGFYCTNKIPSLTEKLHITENNKTYFFH